MRRFITILLLVALIVSLVAAEKIKIRFWTMSLKPKFTDFIEGMIREYEATHPNVEIIWEDIPWNVLQTKLLAAYTSGNPPDIVNLNQDWTVDFAQKGVLLPVDELLPKERLDDYFKGLLMTMQYGEHYYGFPWYTQPAVLFYNKEILKKAGLDRPPSNFLEMLMYAIVIKEKTGIYAFYPGADAFALFGKFALPLVSPDGRRAIFNGPRYVQLFELMKFLYQHDYLPQGMVNPGGWNDKTKMYQSGQLAMMENAGSYTDHVRVNAPSIYAKSDVAPALKDFFGRIGAPYTFGLSIVKGSKHPKEAAEFAAFVTNAKNEVKFCKLVTIYPTVKSALKDPYFSEYDGTLQSRVRIVGARELLDTMFQPRLILPDHERLIQVLNDAYIDVLLGRKSAKEALDYAVKVWNEELSKHPAQYIGGTPMFDYGLSDGSCWKGE